MSSTFRRIHGWLAQFTGASALVAAVGFHVTIAWVGPELATGLLFYSAETDAVPVPLPHPWLPAGLVLVGSAAATVASAMTRRPGLGWLGLGLALVGLGQGVAQILALVEAARP